MGCSHANSPTLIVDTKPDKDENPISAGMLVDLGNAMHNSPKRSEKSGKMPAGYTYFGQFIDHDITFLSSNDRNPSGQFNRHVPFNQITPALDLSCVYGNGFDDMSIPINRENGKMELDPVQKDNGMILVDKRADLPRDGTKKALIGDPRNDENLIVAQLHVAFLRFHNELIEQLDDSRATAQDKYNAARECAIEVYTRVVKQDFLEKLLDKKVYQHYFPGEGRLPNHWWLKDEASIPLEFSGAAYRFGHSLVREIYIINRYHGSANIATVDRLMRMTGRGALGGYDHLPDSQVVDWEEFFDLDLTPGKKPTEAMGIRPRVRVEIPNMDWPANRLAIRNLLRGRELGLPSAQEMIEQLSDKLPDELSALLTPLPKFDILTALDELTGYVNAEKLAEHTPLWYYVLLESSLRKEKSRKKLGVLGSVIVAETFANIINYKPQPSPKAAQSNLEKVLERATYHIQNMGDLIRFVPKI